MRGSREKWGMYLSSDYNSGALATIAHLQTSHSHVFAVFPASFPSKSVWKLVGKISSHCCLTRRLPLVSVGWLQTPSAENTWPKPCLVLGTDAAWGVLLCLGASCKCPMVPMVCAQILLRFGMDFFPSQPLVRAILGVLAPCETESLLQAALFLRPLKKPGDHLTTAIGSPRIAVIERSGHMTSYLMTVSINDQRFWSLVHVLRKAVKECKFWICFGQSDTPNPEVEVYG